MSTLISPLAFVDPQAEIGTNVTIGPFCMIGPHVAIGDDCVLDSHVVMTGNVTTGKGNRFFPQTAIGGEPQDVAVGDLPTHVEIGDHNLFREGVTINRGAQKEDGVTRIENHNMFMANSHVAHNCHIYNHVILVNGVLLGGHVHVHDWATVSGNSVVHHFSTLGTLSFVSGGCRVPHDVPPYMLSAGSDNPVVKTINIIGMRRRGIEESSIKLIKLAHRLLYREHKMLEETCTILEQKCGGVLPAEVEHLLDFVQRQKLGKFGRARESVRNQPTTDQQSTTKDSSTRRAA